MMFVVVDIVIRAHSCQKHLSLSGFQMIRQTEFWRGAIKASVVELQCLWTTDGDATVKHFLCSLDMCCKFSSILATEKVHQNYFSGSIHPAISWCWSCQRCNQFSYYWATDTTPHYICGDIWRFQPRLSVWHLTSQQFVNCSTRENKMLHFFHGNIRDAYNSSDLLSVKQITIWSSSSPLREVTKRTLRRRSQEAEETTGLFSSYQCTLWVPWGWHQWLSVWLITSTTVWTTWSPPEQWGASLITNPGSPLTWQNSSARKKRESSKKETGNYWCQCKMNWKSRLDTARMGTGELSCFDFLIFILGALYTLQLVFFYPIAPKNVILQMQMCSYN